MVHSDKNNKRTKRFICKFLVFFALLVKKGNVNCTEAPKEAYIAVSVQLYLKIL